MRFGLCCLFKAENIAFRTTTAKALSAMPRDRQLEKLSAIGHDNARNLLAAVHAAHRLGIGAFRILSPLFPRMTHPDVGYQLNDLPAAEAIRALLEGTRLFSRENDIRLSFHPDQFVVLSTPHAAILASSLRELEYHAGIAEAVGADVITLHAGGVYGSKELALARFHRLFPDLPDGLKSRLALENDDISYTVRNLLATCEKLAIPLVYDVHHHRCNPDGLAEEEATDLAAATWLASGREPYCHVSSPRNGWGGGDPKPHADYLHPDDFPLFWLEREMTVDIEAKEKELAVVRLMNDLRKSGVPE